MVFGSLNKDDQEAMEELLDEQNKAFANFASSKRPTEKVAFREDVQESQPDELDSDSQI